MSTDNVSHGCAEMQKDLDILTRKEGENADKMITRWSERDKKAERRGKQRERERGREAQDRKRERERESERARRRECADVGEGERCTYRRGQLHWTVKWRGP